MQIKNNQVDNQVNESCDYLINIAQQSVINFRRVYATNLSSQPELILTNNSRQLELEVFYF